MNVVDLGWVVAVVTAALAAGAMVGHALLLGRYFQWVFESDKADIFRMSYPPFVRARQPQVWFDHLFTAALLVVTAYNIVLWLTARACTLSVVAAALQWLFVVMFFGTGFARLEGELLVRGNDAPDQVRRFLSLNPRIPALCALLLIASLACLVLMRVPATTPVR